MSGIEVVGLALGVWPVVVNLAEIYKASKEGFPMRVLTMNIVLYERIFKQSVLKLLQGDEELSEKDRIGLVNGDENFATIWKDPEFVDRLKRRLDAQMFDLVQHKMEEVFKLLTSLKKKIEPKDGKDGELKGPLPKFKNLRLVLQRDEIKKNLSNLKEHVDEIRTLLESYSTTIYSTEQRNNNPSRTRHDSGDRRRRRQDPQHFNDFFEVLNQSFRCQCAVAHEANLRISGSLEIIFPGQEINRAMSGLGLRTRSTTIDSQMTVNPIDLEELDATSEIPRSTWSKSRKQSVSSTAARQQALLVIFNHNCGGRNLAPIADLCQWIKTLRSTSPPNSPVTVCQGLLGTDDKTYMVRAPRANADSLNTSTVMSMDDCLGSCDDYGITRPARLGLALDLAMAIVQFHQTSWIERAWTWRNFSMIKGETYDLVITRRFWSSVSSTRSIAPAPSKFWSYLCDKDPMLVRLGFALIELAMGKTLSDLRLSLDGQKDTVAENEAMKDMEDYHTALYLIRKNIIKNKVGGMYQQAVLACLECKVLVDGGMKPLMSGSNGFEDDFENFIVEPLRQCHIVMG